MHSAAPLLNQIFLASAPREFERLIYYLLIRLGYDVDTLALPFVTEPFSSWVYGFVTV